ncbi:MAG: hypothetical protein GX348_10395 [Veillonellaceae bacterium]|nr:hypothetical protein [Veillonellaceae bacterium]
MEFNGVYSVVVTGQKNALPKWVGRFQYKHLIWAAVRFALAGTAGRIASAGRAALARVTIAGVAVAWATPSRIAVTRIAVGRAARITARAAGRIAIWSAGWFTARRAGRIAGR